MKFSPSLLASTAVVTHGSCFDSCLLGCQECSSLTLSYTRTGTVIIFATICLLWVFYFSWISLTWRNILFSSATSEEVLCKHFKAGCWCEHYWLSGWNPFYYSRAINLFQKNLTLLMGLSNVTTMCENLYCTHYFAMFTNMCMECVALFIPWRAFTEATAEAMLSADRIRWMSPHPP